MKTCKTKKDKRLGISEILNICTWNVRGISNKTEQLEKELKDRNIDIALITETKKKMKGTTDLNSYTMIYSGVSQEERAQAGVAILINKKWKNRINGYEWHNERILTCRFKIERGFMTVICIYSFEEGRREEVNEQSDRNIWRTSS